MRRTLGFITAALALVAGSGCLSACTVTSDGGAAAAPSTSISASGPGSPGASASEGTIPTAALLQPADLSGAEMTPVDGDVGKDLRPPRPCGDAHPSDAARLASTAATAVHPSAGGGESTTPSVILETIVRYRPGSGAQAFDELTAAIARCPGTAGTDTREWRSLGPVDAGDEAVLFTTSTQVRADDQATLAPWTWPVAVARVGDDLVLVADLGWETLNGDEATVRTLVTAAVQRVRAAS
jgi:hypothetical protein